MRPEQTRFENGLGAVDSNWDEVHTVRAAHTRSVLDVGATVWNSPEVHVRRVAH